MVSLIRNPTFHFLEIYLNFFRVAALLVNKGGNYLYHCGAVVIAKYQLLTGQ
jgi:hypothetical protein